MAIQIDNRKKGCPNTECQMNSKKKQFNTDTNYCPTCGTKLIFVCKKCFSEIEDIGSKHKLCSLCEAEIEEKKKNAADKAKDIAGRAAKGVAGAVAAVGVGIGGKLLKDGKKGAIDAGVKVVKDAAKAILKK